MATSASRIHAEHRVSNVNYKYLKTEKSNLIIILNYAIIEKKFTNSSKFFYFYKKWVNEMASGIKTNVCDYILGLVDLAMSFETIKRDLREVFDNN